MPQQLVFVTTDSSAKVRAEERQLIRSHCMREKNKQPGSRRSRREAARAAAAAATATATATAEAVRRSNAQGLGQGSSSSSSSSSQPDLGALSGTLSAAVPSEDLVEEEDTKILVKQECIMPPPSDWALFQFAEVLDPHSQKIMSQYFGFNPIRDALYPFRHFGIDVGFQQNHSLNCFTWLCSEPLCFRAMLLLTSASNDLVSQRSLSSTTYQHLRNTLPILNSRLSDPDAYKNDIVLYVISILAAVAILFGDFNAAHAHARGLTKIMRLRGRFKAVNYNPIIQFSMDRLNFSSAIVTKQWTTIYDSSIWEAPVFPAQVTNLHRSQDMVSVDTLVEPDVATIFYHLQHTAMLLNMHYYRKTPADGNFVRQCLGYVHCNLLDLENRVTDELSKCLHLAMMAVLATTFRLPGLFEQRYCKSLSDGLQRSYAVVRTAVPDLPKTLQIWFVVVLLICTEFIDKLDVYSTWEMTAFGLGWEETRQHLKRVIWIDTFHDDLGQRAFEQFTRGSSGAKQK